MNLKTLSLALALTPTLLSARGLTSLTYTAHANTPFQWTDISSTGSRLTANPGGVDDATYSTALGSSFQFYDGSYNSVEVSTNGNIQFLGSNADYANTTLANLNFGPTVFAFWDDLFFNTDGSAEQGIYYQYFAGGVHPSFVGPTSVVQWTGTYCCEAVPANVRVQALLNHSTGSILIQLNNASDPRGAGNSATIGIQNQFGQYVQWMANVDGESGGGEEIILRGPGLGFDSEPLALQSTVTFDASPVPEPSTYASIGLGLAGMAVIRRRK